MAWRRPGDKPLSEPMVFRLPTHICVIQPQRVKVSALNNLHSIEKQILVKIKLKRTTKLQKKNKQSSIFLETLVKNRVKCLTLTFNNQH